ncbi:MAG: hypothetical protein IKP41_07590 [Bacteroidaceae bacterium]|nr:hypothetical protein [Bacteroidaceae bacterium]
MQEKVTLPQLLPADINAELLLAYYPEGACKISFSGLHKRNTYNDIVDMEHLSNEAIHLTLSRNSLYNALPEYMFHPIDRFDNLPKSEEKERFEQELEKQAEEIANAYKFFAPIDILLFRLRSQVREKVETYAKENVIIQQIVGDTITPQQYSNRFIQKLLPYLPQCRLIRGNKTLLTLMLRKIFLEEGLRIRPETHSLPQHDEYPRYSDSLDMEVGDGFLGRDYDDTVTTYSIQYWNEQECSENLFHLLDEIEELRLFVQDYFLSVEEELRFDISHDEAPMQLTNTDSSHYLNYNINI